MAPVCKCFAIAAGGLLTIGLLTISLAGSATADQKMLRLEKILQRQQEQLAEHERQLAEQARIIADQAQQIQRDREMLEALTLPVGEMYILRATGGADVAPATGARPKARLQLAEQTQSDRQTPVGKPPPKRKKAPPQVQAIADIGGVLTPEGQLVLEPALQYSHADVNRFTFRGIELLGALGIGLLSADDADRDAFIASITGRYGITNRLEGEIKVPYVYRDDMLTNLIPQLPEGDGQATELERSLNDHGLGDIELALHYQLNAGLDGWPIFIGNLRYKSTTGEGPFDVEFDADGIATELAMGSGFHSVEPSLTMLYPSDPAVFFANIGYVVNIKDDVDTLVGELIVGEVDPGDTYRLSFGMAYSINERTSFTLGFKNDFIQETETEFIDPDNGVSTTQSTDTLNVGALLLGYSLQLDPKTAVNLNLELGITDDAPDVLITLRVPFQVDL